MIRSLPPWLKTRCWSNGRSSAVPAAYACAARPSWWPRLTAAKAFPCAARVLIGAGKPQGKPAMSDLNALRQSYLDRISTAADAEALEQVRLAALGKKGEISGMMKELGRMTPEERQTRGAELNRLKDEIDAALRARKQGLEDAALDARLKEEWLDVTLPGRPRTQGTIHPISQVTEEVTAIFADMGFRVAEGPQIESDWFNFDALNIPPEHPARREHDTFFMARAGGDSRPPHVL